MTMDVPHDTEHRGQNPNPTATDTAKTVERIPTSLGFDLLVDPGDYLGLLLLRDAIFEVPETDVVTRIVRPGNVCIDAGCHLGYYSCLLGKLIGHGGRLYSFDANQASCEATRHSLALNGLCNAEVVNAALGDREGTALFHISTSDQTGLSSLGEIPIFREVTSVPMMRLDDFLEQRRIERVHFLKLDVEGAEEIVLRGLGDYLSHGMVDFILIECYDERLQVLKTSTEQIAGILKQVGYQAWEYGTVMPSGWSWTENVRSRGDCNYLFLSPAVRESPPAVSVAPAIKLLEKQREAAREECGRLGGELGRVHKQLDAAREELGRVHEQMECLHNDQGFLRRSLQDTEQKLTQIARENARLVSTLQTVESSGGWRMLNSWRTLRDRLAPERSRLRKLYDSLIRPWRGNQKGRY